ncbi:MAG: hypothetical protein EU539_04215 [Promethearchaeota archaeon]|nr:MAG: hypothetical protein EU539_04215 [Candidatus Lokiarchaeota archaeon]
MEFLNDKERIEILKAWDIYELPRDVQIVKIFEKVRDVQFGSIGSRHPMDVYKANKGTCSGKNFLLRELYKGIGLQTKDMICMQRWKDLIWFPTAQYGLVEFSDELKQMLQAHEIIDFHNYVKILVNNKWIQVDVTIDPPLMNVGFFTTEHWNGTSDMPLCFCGSHKTWDCGDNGPEKKKELTNTLPEHIRTAREHFLKTMTKWIDSLREEGTI